jgi:phage-related protein
MGSGLWEVRTDISHGTTARALFMVQDEKIVLLHGFEKRTRTTPLAELERARKRQKEFQSWKPTLT